jgi:hypothetical protein
MHDERNTKGVLFIRKEWVGLTEIDVLAESKHWRNSEDFINGARWAEDKLKEKNT